MNNVETPLFVFKPPDKPSEDLPLWAEQYRKIVIPPTQATAERQTFSPEYQEEVEALIEDLGLESMAADFTRI